MFGPYFLSLASCLEEVAADDEPPSDYSDEGPGYPCVCWRWLEWCRHRNAGLEGMPDAYSSSWVLARRV